MTPKPFFLGMSRLIVIACLAAGAWGPMVEGTLSAAQPCGIKRSSLYKRNERFVDWKITDSSSTKPSVFHPRAHNETLFVGPMCVLPNGHLIGRLPTFRSLLPPNLPGHHE